MQNNKPKFKFTWDIHYKCNFRCPYCWFFTCWETVEKLSVYLSPDEWMKHWENIHKKYGRVRIEITGGEPFMYPDFVELLSRLTLIHDVKVTTNLSADMTDFIKKIDPEKISLDINLHILFTDVEQFMTKILMLKNAGFKGGVCYLAYPPQMDKIQQLAQKFKEKGVGFALAAFWGDYNGKKYPAAYTAEEREMMRPFIGEIGRLDYHLNAQSTRGKLCNAGHKYADIRANGDVVRCGQLGDKKIGNILREDFQLLDSPSPCEADFCPCNEYDNLV